MSDTSILLFRKAFGALRPANADAERALADAPDGPVRVRITQTRGNTRRMALYRAVLSVAAPILSDKCEGDPMTPDMLHRVLKRKGGLAKRTVLPSGEVEWDTESISFASLTEPKRAEFIDWSFATLTKWLGVPVETLLDEAKAQLPHEWGAANVVDMRKRRAA